MSNANYCVSTTGTQELDSVSFPDLVIAHSYTTTSVKLETFRNGNTQTEQDLAIVCLAIFGDQ